MSDFRFLEPQWVHLLWAVIAVTGLLVWLERRGGDALGRFVSAALHDRLIARVSRPRRYARVLLLGLSGAFLTLALMRPQWGMHLVATPRVGAEIMVCLDVSNSMLAEDVTPNRLGRAKAEIRDLLGYLEGDQVGLIAFAGRASVLSPLTPDFGFLRLVLDEAGPHSVARGGTRLEEPIRKAVAGFGAAGDVSRSILLITDGEDHDSFPLEAAKEAAERGIKVLAIGFGDEMGSEIVMTDAKTGARTPLRDSDGKTVRTRLDGDLLREIALLTGGAYVPAGTGALDLESIYERHIAGLTRGRLDGRGRVVRNDAFQWAVLLGLAALIGAVVATGRRATPRGSKLAVSLFVFFTLLAGPALVAAAGNQTPGVAAARAGPHGGAIPHGGTPPQGKSPPHGGAMPHGEPAQQADAEPAAEPSGGEQPPREPTPVDAREAYNSGLEKLTAGDLAEAEELFSSARSNADTDGTARFRATYNLGWVEVKRADESLAADPQAALDSLHDAASWFREAVALRPGDEAARHNLEVVLRRALALADSLKDADERDLLARINELLEEQRTFLGELRKTVDVADDEEARAAESTRRVFRSLSAEQLLVLANGQDLSDLAGQELASIEAKAAEERTPEEQMRGVQLGGVLEYLHRARERMGQGRSQLRRLEAERAYRRAAAALAALKRARDQLLDPVTVLDGILTDSIELMRSTAMQAAFETSAADLGGAKAPAWLTYDYLAETQAIIQERTADLHSGLEAAVIQSDLAADTEQAPAPEEQALLERARAAEPHLARARQMFIDAAAELEEEDSADALGPQREAVTALGEAREQFLDLRGLIELAYGDEARIQAVVSPAEQAVEEAEIREYAPAAAELQGRNLERGARLARMIDEQLEAVSAAEGGEAPEQAEQLAAERERLELAATRLLLARAVMGRAEENLDALDRGEAPAAGSEPSLALTEARASVSAAVEALMELRRLFFSVIEHLQDTARRQIDLGDETEVVAALAQTASEDETAARLGPMAPRQTTLAGTSRAIAQALAQQAEAPPPSQEAAPGVDPQQAAEMAAKLAEAADHVFAANAAMNEAGHGMNTSPIDLGSVRTRQNEAVESLLAALAVLQPPQEQQGEEGEEEQQEDGEGQDEEQQQQPQDADPSQLLQGVRDREAQRREEQAQDGHSGYEPVEKDW